MYQKKTIFALIIARGGSKGLPGKNLMKIHGKSMLEYTFNAAIGSSYIDRIVLSSEDSEIIKRAKQIGIEVPFVRPSKLAEDNIGGNDVVEHALKSCPGYDYVVLLQPTSPLRTSNDIDNAIEQCIIHNKDSCVSVTKVKKSPFWMYSIGSEGNLLPFLDSILRNKNRQEHPTLYVPNGAIYVSKCNVFLKIKSFYGENTGAYVMPPERSVDIDDRLDFLFTRMLIEERSE